MGLDAMAMYRFARKLHQRGIPLLPDFLRMAIYYLHNSYIPYEAELGEGTQLGYGGIGVVIHKDAKIGRHCLISHQVTISNRSAHEGVPEIGDYVRIGAGAKILGNVRIGDFAVIGANAVVVRDVPAAAVVAGVPARVLRKEGDPLLAYLREMGKLTPGAARLPPGQLAAHFTETTLQ